MALVTSLIGLLTGGPSLLHLGLAACVSLLIVVLLLILNERKKPQLFSKDRRLPPRALVTDQGQRDKVLRQNFKPELVPPQCDAIIVGSGMGGLTCGALMSLAGKRVLVLEQHDRAGGCTHSFVEKGYEFDIGIHYIGGMEEIRKRGKKKAADADGSKKLLDQITRGQLQWQRMSDEFDVVAIGGSASGVRRYPIPTGLDNVAAFLSTQFPHESKGIDKFFELCWEADEAMQNFGFAKVAPAWLARPLLKYHLLPGSAALRKHFDASLKDVVNSLVQDPDLRAILSYCWGDFGVPPSRAPFAMQATLWAHFSNGGFYPIGGASEIAFHIIPTIEASGGRVLVRAEVDKILTEGDRVVGVRVNRGKGRPSIEIHAPLVISNASMLSTFNKLLPKDFLSKSTLANILPTLNPGLACFQVFVGLRGSASDLGVKAQNIWAFSDPDGDTVLHDYLSKTPEQAVDAEIPLMFVSFPSAKDPTWDARMPGNEPKTTCAIVTLVNWDWFRKYEKDNAVVRGRDDDDYNELKNALTHRLWNQVVALFPQLEDKVDYVEGGSPLTHNYYIRATAGEIYGLDHDIKRFAPEPLIALRSDVGIKGFLFSGQDNFTCGFIGALYGGVAAAGTATGLGLRIFMQMDEIGEGWNGKKTD